MPCSPLTTAAAETNGSSCFAIRRFATPATPATATTGVSATGSHIILLREAGAVVREEHLGPGDDGADRRDAGEHAFEAAVFDVAEHVLELVHDRSSETLSRKIVEAIVALCGWPRRKAVANFNA